MAELSFAISRHIFDLIQRGIRRQAHGRRFPFALGGQRREHSLNGWARAGIRWCSSIRRFIRPTIIRCVEQQLDRQGCDWPTRAERRTPSYQDPMDLAANSPSTSTRMAARGLRTDGARDAAPRRALPGLDARLSARISRRRSFASNRDSDYVARDGARCRSPIKLICADPQLEGQMPARLCAGRWPRPRTSSLEYAMLPGTTHFLQIERPAECIRVMEDFLAAKRHSRLISAIISRSKSPLKLRRRVTVQPSARTATPHGAATAAGRRRFPNLRIERDATILAPSIGPLRPASIG